MFGEFFFYFSSLDEVVKFYVAVLMILDDNVPSGEKNIVYEKRYWNNKKK